MGQITKNCTLFFIFFNFQVTVNIENTILLSKNGCLTFFRFSVVQIQSKK